MVGLVRLAELRDPAAARRRLHTVLRNVCLMRLRQRREVPCEYVEPPGHGALTGGTAGATCAARVGLAGDRRAQRDERLTVILRYFTRCASYHAIARVTSVPVGTVRSRLNRARAHLRDGLSAHA